MEWSKEKLRDLYRQKFCLELLDIELNGLWKEARIITPLGNQMNVASTPQMLRTICKTAFQRSNCSLNHTHFKKINEEISPAIDFALFLKKNGFGEHYILLSDNPDINLIRKNNYTKRGYKIMAIPLEVTFIKDISLNNISESTTAKKIIKVISKKLMRSYGEHTTLLIVIDTVAESVDLKELNNLLQETGKNFRYIYIYTRINNDTYSMIRVYPDLDISDPITTKEFESLIY